MILQNIITVVFFGAGIYLFLLGWLIFRENPRQSVSRILSALLFLGALGPMFAAFGLLFQTSPALSTDSPHLQRLFLIWEFFFPQLFLFSLVFPIKHKVLSTYPRIYIFLYLPPALHILLLTLFDSAEQINALLQVEQLIPWAGIWLEPFKALLRFVQASLSFLMDYHGVYFSVVNLLYILTANAIMQFSYSRLEGYRLRNQAKFVIWGIRVATGLYAIGFLLPNILFIEVKVWQSYSLTAIGLLLGAGSLTWAIIRYQFLDISFIIRRGFIISAASGLLAGLYLLLFAEIKRLAETAFGQNARFIEVLFLIITVIAFQPLLNLLEYVVDRLFMKRLGNYRDALQRLGREVLTLFEPEALREKVTNALSESLLLEVVYVMLPDRRGRIAVVLPGESDASVAFEPDGELSQLIQSENRAVFLDDLLLRLPNDPHLRQLRQMRAHLLFPLKHRHRLLGVLVLGQKITQTDYTSEETGLLAMLCEQIAISLENIQLYREQLEKQQYEKELAVAKEIQRLLLPHRRPQSSYYEISALNVPSREIGGDYHDFIDLDDERLGIAIGDVVGKGIPGALLMSNLQAVFRAYALRYPSPKTVVTHINEHLAHAISAEKYITFFYGVLDPVRKKLVYTNAGHNYPLLCRGGKSTVVEGADLIVGVRAGATYHQRSLTLQAGDILIFYTDGITEAFDADEKQYGEQRLVEVALRNRERPLEQILEMIYSNVCQHASDSHILDDLTIVLLRIR